jgi:hypothetical protein
MIDVDEAGFKIEHTNPNFGKTVSWLRCYLEGEYNRDKKINCLIAISADSNYNMEWHGVWPQEEGGTDVYRIYIFFSEGYCWVGKRPPWAFLLFHDGQLKLPQEPDGS